MRTIVSRRPFVFAACATLLAAAAVQAQSTLYEDNEVAGMVNTVSATGKLTPYKTINDGDDLKGLAFDSKGNLFVGDRTDGTIRKVTPARVVSTFVSLPDASINYLTIGAGDNLFASDGASDSILEITPAGAVSTYAALPGFADPEGMAFDASGNLFVASRTTDTQVAVVYKITPAGAVSDFADLPKNSEPNGLVIDAGGNLYVAETLGGRIVKITSAGAVSTFATLAADEGPVSLAMDADGNLYTTLSEDTRIQKISPSGVESDFASDQNTPGRIIFGPAIVQKPVITSAATTTAQVGKTFSYQITASNHPKSYGVLGLRPGLSVNGKTGLISGTPTGAGAFTLTLKAANAAGVGMATLKLTIKPPTPVITSPGTASAKVGSAFSYQIKATGNPTSYGVLGLFKGITVNPKTGLISGTPTAAGTHSLTLRAANSGGIGTKSLALTVSK